MAGFLSADQITKIRDLANTLHTTFARTITVYKNAKKTLIASTNAWNSLYGRTNTGSDSAVEYSIASQTFSARIYYDDMDTAYLNDGGRTEQAGSQNKVLVADGTVRIVVQETAYNYLVEARRVEFDGKKFIIESDGEPRGLTENQFYTFVLSPVDE
jgi:hypothetical protein